MRNIRLIAYTALICLASIAASASESVQIELNKGRMVRLDRPAASVMVADPTIADIQVVGPKMVYVHAKKIGETSLYAIDRNDAPIIDATIEVTHNLSKLMRSIQAIAPNADIELKTVDGGLVMGGFVDSMQESESIRTLAASFLGDKDKLVNLVSTAGSDQVSLMVKVAEVSRNELKRFGINLAAVLSSGSFAFQVLQGRSFLGAGGAISRLANDNSINVNYTRGSDSLNSVIDALEKQGLVSVLAEPSLTTASGKTANFLAGGEFPIPLVDSDGKITVEYKPYGISLNFTPVVLSKDKISLTVRPEVSTISSVNSLSLGTTTQFVIPSLATRRAETTVELGSGQTFAIAGLLKNDRSNTVSKFPGLGDMPVLGALFRSQEFQNDQSELVILVTPYIVRPTAERKMQTPLDGYVPPNDLERVLLGKLYQEHSMGSDTAPTTDTTATVTPKLHGTGGFIME